MATVCNNGLVLSYGSRIKIMNQVNFRRIFLPSSPSSHYSFGADEWSVENYPIINYRALSSSIQEEVRRVSHNPGFHSKSKSCFSHLFLCVSLSLFLLVCLLLSLHSCSRPGCIGSIAFDLVTTRLVLERLC